MESENTVEEHPQRTLDLEYQDCGEKLRNLIFEITEIRHPGLFISVF